jgi:hypothetical protein
MNTPVFAAEMDDASRTANPLICFDVPLAELDENWFDISLSH